MSDREDTIRDGRSFDTMDRMGDRHMYYSSFGSDKNYDQHHYHPYRSDKGYFSAEFKKEKLATFNGEMKKSHDA